MSTIVNDDDDFIVINGKKVLKDGRSLRVRLDLMDRDGHQEAALRRPGPRHASDAAADERREVAYGGFLADLGRAWEQPDPPPATADTKPPITDAREAALAAHDADLTSAWKGTAA
jgi:hypothetical protein